MKRTALILILVAACGGKKPKDTTTANMEQHATKEEPAKPEPTEKPAEKPEKPAETKPDEGALAQAALTEQYDAGKKIFADKKCASCHGDHGEGGKKSPPVIGDKALPEKAPATAKLRKGVAFKTAADVMGFVKAKMPLKSPGTLTDDEAAAVSAWILSESKVNLEKKLDASNAASVNLR